MRLFKVMRRVWLTERKTRRAQAVHVDITDMADPPAVAPRQEDIVLLKEARAIIGTMPAWASDVLLSARFAEHEYHETAERLGIEIGTVKSRLNRASAQLCRLAGGA